MMWLHTRIRLPVLRTKLRFGSDVTRDHVHRFGCSSLDQNPQLVLEVMWKDVAGAGSV